MKDDKVRLSDVCQPFTRQANYNCDVPWNGIEANLEHWNETKRGLNLLHLDPDFQRVHVWTETQQIALVEYLLRDGYAAREIYFNCSTWMTEFNTPIELVDGKQRLQAVRRFLNNEIPAFGYTYDRYDDVSFRNRSCLRFYVNNLQSRAEVLTWYLDLNTGGTPHTSEEIEKVRRMLVVEQLGLRNKK